MNKLYTLLIAVVLMSGTVMQAQTTAKFGHVDSQSLLQMMPETAQAEKELQVLESQLQSRLTELTEGYQMEIAKFQALPVETPESTVSDMRDGILGIEKRIQDFQINAEQDMVTKREGLLTPIITKLQDAINAVGEENGFTYVFDSSTGAIVYQGGGEDVTPLIKTKLGITG